MISYKITEDKHTRTNEAIYVVKFTTLNKEEFTNINRFVKNNNGYYSKFKKGFIFSENPQNILEKEFPQIDIEQIKNISIESFCQKNNILLTGSGQYRSLKEHDSLVIDVYKNNFYWNSRQVSGDIINFVENLYNVDFKEAINIINPNNITTYTKTTHDPEIEYKEAVEFNINDIHEDKKTQKNLYAYLLYTRKIDKDVVDDFFSKRLIRQDINKNIIFYNKDEKDNIVGATLKGTNTYKSYDYIAPGSSISGFSYNMKPDTKDIFFVEASIDLMSFISLYKEIDPAIKDWGFVSMNALKHNCILHWVEKYPNANIFIGVDNDFGGDTFYNKLKTIEELKDKDLMRLTPKSKDWNDDLKNKKEQESLEEIEKKTDAIFKSVEDEIKKTFSDPRIYTEYLDFLGKFYNYSYNNLCLIQRANPETQFIGSAKYFKGMGYEVKKEELSKGIDILVPVKIKFFMDEDGKSILVSQATKEQKKLIKEGKINIKTILKFNIGQVYDIKQTTYPVSELPKLLPRELTGEDHANLFPALKNIVEKDFKVDFSNNLKGAKGSFNLVTEEILLNVKNSPMQNIKTLIHEYAHGLLHHKTGIAPSDSSSEREVEAESIAYVVCKNLGIDTSQYSFSYIRSWGKANDLATLKTSADIIKKTASKILKDLDDVLKISPELTQKNNLQMQQQLIKQSPFEKSESQINSLTSKKGEVENIKFSDDLNDFTDELMTSIVGEKNMTFERPTENSKIRKGR